MSLPHVSTRESLPLTHMHLPLQWPHNAQATATPRACYVCSKPTTTCLATTNALDFLYACEAHLSDTGFVTELVDPVSKEEIARVKAEWEAKEAARKKEKAKVKATATSKDGGKDDDGKKDVGGKGEDEKNGDGAGAGSLSATGSGAAAAPTHKRYSLHRDFYAMRQDEHRRKRQTKQTQELAPRFPGAPHGSLIS